MALFKITVKKQHNANAINLEKGMSVEVSSSSSNPLNSSSGKEAIYQAFLDKYNIDIKKNCGLSSVYLGVEKLS